MKRADFREQLLNAGVNALHSKGFNGCGVQEITEAAGVPKGSFYNYFESKEVFSDEVLKHYWEQIARTNLAVLRDESLPALERLKKYFTQRAEVHATGNYERGCMLGNLSTEISGQSRLVRDSLGSLFAGWVRVVANCIRDAQEAGDVTRDLDATIIANFLVNAWQGAVMRAKVDRDSGAMDAFFQIVFSTVLVNRSDTAELAAVESR